MTKVKGKYGVNTFINEVHVNTVEFSDTFKLPEYRYIIEIVEIEQYNGNGINEMKIYTEGKLEVFEIGNWKISPIVKMPFNWIGLSDIIEMQDRSSIIMNKRGTPDSATLFQKKGYEKDVKWVFETIRGMSEIENVEHNQLLEHINETNRLLSIYTENGTYIESILKVAERIDYEINTVRTLEISEKSQLLVKLKINETIDFFNKMKLKRIE